MSWLSPSYQSAAQTESRRLRALPWGWLAYWGTAALLLGGIIHICIVLLMPYLAPQNAWARLSPLLETNRMAIFPLARPGQQALPYLSPDIGYAVCRYDVTAGPVLVRAKLPNAHSSLGLHDPLGNNFYIITGEDVRREEITLVLFRRGGGEGEKKAIAPGQAKAEVIWVSVAAPQGLAVIRLPLAGRAYAARVRSLLAQASCAPMGQTGGSNG